MGDFDQAIRAPFAQLHQGGKVLATIALDPKAIAPPIIIWQHRAFHQTSRSFEAWWYDEIEALWVDA
jgi:hypothetical protein